MTESPLVSIVIPVYNGTNYLKEAIESALNQTYHNIEVIVVNDGSIDSGGTERIALSYGERIRYISKVNGGVASALNLGISEMKGDYFSWLSHDDVYKIDKISKQIDVLNGIKKDDVILYSDYEYIDEKSLFIRDKRLNRRKSIIIDSLSAVLLGRINGITMLIPKKAFLSVGSFDLLLKTTQDYDLWFRLAKKYEFKHVPIILASSRIHSKQDSRSEQHIDECNELYISFIEWLYNSNSNKISEPIFLLRFLLHLTNSGYLIAAKYLVFKSGNIIVEIPLLLIYLFFKLFGRILK